MDPKSSNKLTPYDKLPPRSFWKTAVAERSNFDIGEIWIPKLNVSRDDKVASFGSCFAQHIGRGLRACGYNWLITEAPPNGLSEENCRRFNYGLFTCRTGNIYTASLLRQWIDWAIAAAVPPEEVWHRGSRIIDPFRPRIEPDGFESVEEMRRSRYAAIAAFGDAIRICSVFVFTMGLTESWFNVTGQCEYPMCPGTAGGGSSMRSGTASSIRASHTYWTTWSARSRLCAVSTPS